MPGRMIWFDKRLKGQPPPIAPNIFTVDDKFPLNNAVGWIATYARAQGGLDELIVMCHGFEANWDLAQKISTTKAVGGFGLAICKEGISLWNVNVLKAWNASVGGGRLINRITIYACAAADTGPGNVGTYGDGRRFMGELAISSGAYVVAARDSQAYNPESVRPINPTPIDFGEWEGPVYLFDPSTGQPQPFQPGPMA